MIGHASRKSKYILMPILLLVAAVIISACGSAQAGTAAPGTEEPNTSTPSATANAGDKEPYRVGALFSVTGFNSPLGVPEKETTEMLVEEINAAGGINGHPLEVVIYDTESDETKAVTLAKRLIEQDKVSAIIGPSATGESLAIVDTVEKAGVPLISCAASAKIVQPVKPYVYKTPQSDALVVSELYSYIKAQGTTKIAILTASGGYGTTGKAALEAAAPDAGLTIVASEVFGDKDTDMSVQLTKIKGTDAQAVVVWGTNPGPAIIAKNAKTLGIDIPMYNSHGIANKKFIELAGDAAEGIKLPAGKLVAAASLPDSDPQKAVLADYLEKFQAKYGKPADSFGGYAYDALSMVVKAMEKAGNDKQAIRDDLESMEFVGISGIFKMTPEDHNGLGKGAVTMIEIKNGQWTLAN